MISKAYNRQFRDLQKRHYNRDVARLDFFRQGIDQRGFAYSLTLKAAKVGKLIDSLGIFPKANVLDIGCRDGRLLNKLQVQFHTHNYGIDISFRQMQANQKINPFNNHYFVADAECLPFAAGSFDFVICLDVLEHLPNYQKCIKEVADLLKNNSAALFYAISKRQKYTWGWFLRKITRGLLGKGMGEVHQPEYFLSPQETVVWCEKCGLEIKKIIYFHCFFVWAVDNFLFAIKNLLRSILNMRKKSINPTPTLTSNSNVSYPGLIVIRVWSVLINILLPISEFLDSLWQKKGYSSGFFFQVSKR